MTIPTYDSPEVAPEEGRAMGAFLIALASSERVWGLLPDGTLRCDYFRCPLAQVATLVSLDGRRYNSAQWEKAAIDLGIPTDVARSIVYAADNVITTREDELWRGILLKLTAPDHSSAPILKLLHIVTG